MDGARLFVTTGAVNLSATLSEITMCPAAARPIDTDGAAVRDLSAAGNNLAVVTATPARVTGDGNSFSVGATAIAGASAGAIQRWVDGRFEPILTPSGPAVGSAVAAATDGRVFWADSRGMGGGIRNPVFVYDPRDGSVAKVLDEERMIAGLEWAPAGLLVVLHGRGEVGALLLRPDGGQRSFELAKELAGSDLLSPVAWDGDQALVFGNVRRVVDRELKSGTVVVNLEDGSGSWDPDLSALDFSPDGANLLVAIVVESRRYLALRAIDGGEPLPVARAGPTFDVIWAS